MHDCIYYIVTGKIFFEVIWKNPTFYCFLDRIFKEIKSKNIHCESMKSMFLKCKQNILENMKNCVSVSSIRVLLITLCYNKPFLSKL